MGKFSMSTFIIWWRKNQQIADCPNCDSCASAIYWYCFSTMQGMLLISANIKMWERTQWPNHLHACEYLGTKWRKKAATIILYFIDRFSSYNCTQMHFWSHMNSFLIRQHLDWIWIQQIHRIHNIIMDTLNFGTQLAI